ncbi:hypothetical protein RB195_021226 [Necator americanus]|uniref:Uncharacterized protein n=1 Tax=Necator americanus TaxID=51031 RepID=A0ABR1EBZ4_NECAM
MDEDVCAYMCSYEHTPTHRPRTNNVHHPTTTNPPKSENSAFLSSHSAKMTLFTQTYAILDADDSFTRYFAASIESVSAG